MRKGYVAKKMFFFSEDVRKRTICEGMFCKGGPIVKITFYDEGDFL